MGCDYELCIKCKKKVYRPQYRLNDLIERLRELPQDMPILLGDSFSYRGDYNDISFEPLSPGDYSFVKYALIEAENSNGARFEGWKGGDFDMDDGTPVWYAHEGSCGSEIVFITDDGVIITRDE